MADRLIVPRKLWVDLTEFGFGIRPVKVISGGGGGDSSQPGPDTVGTDQIVNDSIQMEDLNQEVKDTMMTGEDRVTQDDLNTFDV